MIECGGGYDAVVVGSGYGGSVAACRMSMAGLKVCLLEKGRRWEASDFPTDSLKMWSTTRIEHGDSGWNVGPKDALFQIRIQDDALAATACGLGGGSLVNCGVMISTTARARRDPRWPKSWERDWDMYEASASDMLRIHSVPVKFKNSKIMEDAVDEDYVDNPIKLSMSLGKEKGDEKNGSCLACGNCLAGCPYNAKNSTDRTYLVTAVQEGCTIRTGCEVQYVVRNVDGASEEKGRKGKTGQRRWLVFLNECDYIQCDIVVVSAGVLGTAKIMFQSQLRGLTVSDKLGSRFSCNGNNVAYLAGTVAPVNARGLTKKQVSDIPFEERPGPSISSSYTSSLGFSVQSAVIPEAYPTFLIKGWLSTYMFFYSMIERLLGLKSDQEMALNAIGHDDSNGKIMFDKDTNRVLFQPPRDNMLSRKVEAFQKLAKKFGGVLFMSPYRSTSVHLLGGCVASPDVSSGVCNSEGQVYDTTSATGVHSGLYICDASIIPCSIGVNPCLTITAAAEHVSRHIVKDAIEYYGNLEIGYSDKRQGIIDDLKKKESCSWEVMTRETMRGEVGGMPCTAFLTLAFNPSKHLLRGKVGGHVDCRAIETGKLYVIKGEVDLCKTDARTPYTQYMHYYIILASSSGSRYVLEGRKIMNPYLLALYTWRESTTLNVTFRELNNNKLGEHNMDLKGKLHISPLELLKSVCAFEGRGTSKFLSLFVKSLTRTYILQQPRGSLTKFIPDESCLDLYPKSTFYEIKTEDNFTVTCQHWKCSYTAQKPYPVLLLNGYSTESYFLPTEPNDLVRTLLKKGHDVWILHARMHWSNPSNNFSIEDIGRYDIPAAMRKIIDSYDTPVKVHVVAHCMGGVSTHIAIMGGHISAKHIASLSCTNSSMFFKVTPSSYVKMWLPLIQVSMAIMGENTILPMFGSPASFRHRLLKTIARLIPRYERCTCDECEVFSGVFGNTYWHENISESMHHWMNTHYLPRLPMAGLAHLKTICKAGFIVDANGNNSYLIHPERMSLPTLYISGGRTLLVTPEISFLANKYMKLHQPGYRHERVVVDGYGHSDLLIGEESPKKVFPHILKHMELAEEERSLFDDTPADNGYVKEALTWSADPYERDGRYESWIFTLIIFILVLVVVYVSLV